MDWEESTTIKANQRTTLHRWGGTVVLLLCHVGIAEEVQFNRDVRPILADKCFNCHGPDAGSREAEMRLDDREDTLRDRDGYYIVDLESPLKSELLTRVSAQDDEGRMPPPESGTRLTSKEIETLKNWIVQGARYETHWSFIPPNRPEVPQVKTSRWCQNEIDNFVLANLEKQSLSPNTKAEPFTLIRRVSLDLTGIPPTVAELDSFEQAYQENPQSAYADLVDRLLKSPRYGERMAVMWLDAARYADTNGYFTDNDRTMWPWRDWVINAFNQNMPFDQFTIEQIAGDLLPEATIEQKIATGFNRNHMVNNETGIIEEEFRVEYVVDRVDTTSTVWLGLTMGCARCHDHKFDPISQKDFYRFFAYFNNVPERGLSGSQGNSTPVLEIPNMELQTELKEAQQELAEAREAFKEIEPDLNSAQAKWELTAASQHPLFVPEGQIAHFALEELVQTVKKKGVVKSVEGFRGKAVKFVGEGSLETESGVDFDRDNAFSYGAWVRSDAEGCLISKTDDANNMRGFDITLRKGKAIVNFVHFWNRNAIQVASVNSIPSQQWQHILVTYDGSSAATGVKLYLDGKSQSLNIDQDTLTGTIRNQQPFRFGRRASSAPYKGTIDEVRVFNRALAQEEVNALVIGEFVDTVCKTSEENRTAKQKQKLRDLFLAQHENKRFTRALAEIDRRQKQVNALTKSSPSLMVMQESDMPRQAFVLLRGEYDQHGEEVASGVPDFLNPTSSAINTESSNRLALGKWLVDSQNPLTARVTVNRLWQQLFGVGIVKTVDDFGTQGEWPSHPELLDWLALELINSGWDLQHVLKLIVSSSTYQQSANAPAKMFADDPENRLLARGPRFRMDAEMLRDNALAISGLLVEKIGGPSVKPYQPAGLWKDVTYDSGLGYVESKGASLYRRSLYSFWKRQLPPPNMTVFDAPTRETCTVSRSRTNTPLQALALMNDPTFVEAARKLAEQLLLKANLSDDERLVLAFLTATARRPNANEIHVLKQLLEKERVQYKENSAASNKLIHIGSSDVNNALSTPEFAAWTTVTSLILSLDETITKP